MSGDQGSEVQEWLDRQAILDLIHRYSDSITRGEYERTAAVFAPDAVWEEPQAGLRFDTAGEFIEFLAAGTASMEVLIQTPHSPVVELVGAGRAKATTTIHEFGRGVVTAEYMFGGVGTELNFDRYGIYYERCGRAVDASSVPIADIGSVPCVTRLVTARTTTRRWSRATRASPDRRGTPPPWWNARPVSSC